MKRYLRLGDIALSLNLVTAPRLAGCLDLQRELAQAGHAIKLGWLLVARCGLTPNVVSALLRTQARSRGLEPADSDDRVAWVSLSDPERRAAARRFLTRYVGAGRIVARLQSRALQLEGAGIRKHWTELAVEDGILDQGGLGPILLASCSGRLGR
ncbi:MAG: hypothetical protein HY720_31245 [Planctomycetes bacterium]|nr:hypothetical protein [Planctomycetota bacterium]